MCKVVRSFKNKITIVTQSYPSWLKLPY